MIETCRNFGEGSKATRDVSLSVIVFSPGKGFSVRMDGQGMPTTGNKSIAAARPFLGIELDVSLGNQDLGEAIALGNHLMPPEEQAQTGHQIAMHEHNQITWI